LQPYHDITQPAIAKALAHPLRSRILGALEGRTASPAQLADELDVALGVVAYHIRRLHQLGFLELVDRVQKRGAVEHYYTAKTRPRFTHQAWGALPNVIREAATSAALQQISSQVNAAAAAGGFDASDIHLTRSPVTVDKDGWKELSRKLDEVIEAIRRIEAESKERLARSNHQGEEDATVVLMLFHSAPAGTAARVEGHDVVDDSAAQTLELPPPRPDPSRQAGRNRLPGQPPRKLPPPRGAATPFETLAAHHAYWQEGRTLREVAETLGITAEALRQRFRAAGLRTRNRHEARRTAGTGTRRIERENQARDALQAAYTEADERFLTRTAYDRLRRRMHPDWPTSQTIVKALGGGHWIPALESVGLPTRKAETQAARQARWARIRKLWGEGYTVPEIADEIGKTPGSVGLEISKMRAAGLDLRYRRQDKRRAAQPRTVAHASGRSRP
jgi:DNA-binding transcriptional ArsR family regulator